MDAYSIEPDIGGLAERLGQPSEADFRRPPVQVCECGYTTPVDERRALTREVLSAAVGRIGPPTLYGGAEAGPVIRWRDAERTVLLDCGARGLQLSVWHTEELEAFEQSRFEVDLIDPAEYFSRLPYLWQLHREAAGSPPLHFPAAPFAQDWSWLEGSLAALLRGWQEQLPAQLDRDTAGFNIVPAHAWQLPFSALSVLCSELEGVLLLVDDRPTGGGTPGEVMRSRGWQTEIRGWWLSDFDDLDAASTAARMAIEEIRRREVPSPAALAVSDVRCEGGGLLVLPGLTLRGRRDPGAYLA
ncbi:hypothetical protein ACO0M4_05830 [Streptomyces sp. RGM 3693]|uniref:hypothetical protein n=1 Tax=Streptomyces sp. RGM 3693 TaxID=3413284 RepID=UPI003D2D2B1E